MTARPTFQGFPGEIYFERNPYFLLLYFFEVAPFSRVIFVRLAFLFRAPLSLKPALRQAPDLRLAIARTAPVFLS